MFNSIFYSTWLKIILLHERFGILLCNVGGSGREAAIFVQMCCPFWVLPNQRPGCSDLVVNERQIVLYRKMKSEKKINKQMYFQLS